MPDWTLVGSFVDGSGARHNVEVTVAARVTYLLTGNGPFTNDHEQFAQPSMLLLLNMKTMAAYASPMFFPCQ